MAENTPAAETARELRDTVRDLERQFGGTFERTPFAGGVRVRLRQFEGDVVSGTGATTFDAVADLARRVAAYLAALEVAS